MTERNAHAPLVTIARLWAKTSAKGGTYYVGRMGPARVMLLENKRRQDEKEHTHALVVCEAQDTQPRQEKGQ